MLKPLYGYLLCIGWVFFTSSCVNMKSATYFNDIKDSTILVDVTDLEPVIQKSDILSITVTSMNPELTQIFNPGSNGGDIQAAGYLVNQDGEILFPLLGKIKAAGMTKRALQQRITKALTDKQLLQNPMVDIRYLNYKIYIMGEVAHPTVITVPNENINILQAISSAGDLTLSARRDNVMVVRQEEGKKIIKRLDLNNPDLFKSPYFNLKSNDIVYVQPNKTKVAGSSGFRQAFPIVISTLSFLLLVTDRVVR